MSILLKARHQSWGLRTRYDWSSNQFELSQEGDLHIIVKYYDPDVDCVVKVSEDDLRKIRDLIPREPITKKVGACDGDAWEFTAYSDSGEVIFSRDLDYIYHIDPLLEIGNILESYIPEYEKPKYDEETSSRKSDGEVKIPDFLLGN